MPTDTSPSVTEGRPNGDAGDAIDFALDHMDDPWNRIDFLECWRSDDLSEWPEYSTWLAVQREGARKARLTLPVDETQLVERMQGKLLEIIIWWERRREDLNVRPELRSRLLAEKAAELAALSIVRPHLSEIERLRAQLDEARGVAMEEAAKVAEKLGRQHTAGADRSTVARNIAAAIRARISGRG